MTDAKNTPAKIRFDGVSASFAGAPALAEVSVSIADKEVSAIIGPSGSGKSTFLRCINRMNDVIPRAKVSGAVYIDDENINAPEVDPVLLRGRAGMVFQRPNPFPKSIYDNVAYGPRIHGLARDRIELDEIVEANLSKAGLWNEVKDRLGDSGESLSIGQQQRLCIARALAVTPEIMLMDEPCSALDPIATARIEALIDELKRSVCIIIVTHSMQQAARVSQKTGFLQGGRLIEFGDTESIFMNPDDTRTQDYITGRMG